MVGFASLITLGVIFGFVFVVVFLAAYFSGDINIATLLALTVAINVVSWLISPFFMDLMFRWFYRTRQISIQDIETRSARLAAFIKKTCEKYHFKIPMFRIIEDDNPTAFAFGSGTFNARLCFSEGLFTYLTEDEIEAVIAHELGHIQRRDFIIMTIASTGVQILYELSQFLMRRKSDRKNNAAWIGLLAYVFYFIGMYLLLFLSRTREYGADEFSAHETENPDALARALVKIAYGIVAKPDEAHQARLMHSTRALGPYDYQTARHLGTAFESSKQDWSVIGKVIAYDFISPWAKILQLQSTHPLTGRRIMRLNEFTKQKGKAVSIPTENVKSTPVDHQKLYSGFAFGVFVYFLSWILPLLVIVTSIVLQNSLLLVWLPASLGVAQLLKIFYKYPESTPQKTTTLEMLTDLYANPIRGNLYSLEGTVIGRGVAGARFSEDIMMQDEKGLIYLNYESAFSFIGNFMFGWTKVQKLIGQKAAATGWFFRSVGHHLDLKNLIAGNEHITSHPKLWGTVFATILIAVSYYAYVNPGILPF